MTLSSEKTLINVLGAGRSGTTMLDLMLGNDDRSFSLGEVHAWFRPFRRHHRKVDCNCGNEHCPYWLKLLRAPENTFHARAFEELDVDFLVDSSKSLPWVIDNVGWAAESNVRVVNIVIHKPLVSYIHSVWKRGEEIDVAIHRYKTYYGRLIDSGIRVVSVSFNDLVDRTDEALSGLCAITGQADSPRRKQFWLGRHHQIFGSGGARRGQNYSPNAARRREPLAGRFQSLVPSIEVGISRDKRLARILEFLSNCHYGKGGRVVGSAASSVNKPYWYYGSKAKQKLRGFWPEYYERQS